jgi:hypothetical protein
MQELENIEEKIIFSGKISFPDDSSSRLASGSSMILPTRPFSPPPVGRNFHTFYFF